MANACKESDKKKITVFSNVAHEKAFIYPNVSKMLSKGWKTIPWCSH